MNKEIKVDKITQDGLIECTIDEIAIGERFMFEDIEYMRIDGWSYPPYLEGVPLYVDMNTFKIKIIHEKGDDKE